MQIPVLGPYKLTTAESAGGERNHLSSIEAKEEGKEFPGAARHTKPSCKEWKQPQPRLRPWHTPEMF